MMLCSTIVHLLATHKKCTGAVWLAIRNGLLSMLMTSPETVDQGMGPFLAASIKEPIDLYFDTNLHVGL